jgi:hypothetical protein
MTDRRSDLDERRLPQELVTWFAGEVHQAELDLRRSPLRGARTRTRVGRGIAGPALAGFLMVILVLAGMSRLPGLGDSGLEPTGTAIDTPSSGQEPMDRPDPTVFPEPTTGLADRYRDGIPSLVDGQPVLRQEPLSHPFPVDDTSFLVGGWLLHVEAVRLCLEATPALDPCANPVLSRTPLERPDALSIALGTIRLEEGPVVLRVHRNDPRATDCPADLRPACRDALAVEAVMWTDDEVSRTGPIGTIHVMRRLASLVPGFELTPIGSPIDPPMAGDNPCDPGYPVQTWTTPGLRVAQILVFPAVAAREAVDDNFTASGWFGTRPYGTTCGFMTDSFSSHVWVTGHNVMVAVVVDFDGGTPEQRALVDNVTEALSEP